MNTLLGPYGRLLGGCIVLLTLASSVLGCSQQPLDKICQDWLARRGKQQARLEADEEASAARIEEVAATMSPPTDWGGPTSWSALGLKTVLLETRWSEGALRYKFTFSPAQPRQIREAESRLRAMGAKPMGFQIRLLDGAGFETFSFFVALRDMSQGQNLKSREAIGSVACPATAYNLSVGWSARTSGF